MGSPISREIQPVLSPKGPVASPRSGVVRNKNTETDTRVLLQPPSSISYVRCEHKKSPGREHWAARDKGEREKSKGERC